MSADKAAATALFKFFDENSDNTLSFDELKEGMANVGSKFSEADVRAFFDKVKWATFIQQFLAILFEKYSLVVLLLYSLVVLFVEPTKPLLYW